MRKGDGTRVGCQPHFPLLFNVIELDRAGPVNVQAAKFVERRTQADDYRIFGWRIGDDHCSALRCSNSRLSSTCSRQSPWSSDITCPAIKALNCSLCPWVRKTPASTSHS